MKTFLKLFSIFLIAGLVFTGCSKDDDPADNDLFIGTYEGSLGYVGNGENISTDDGRITVTKVGDTYRFSFSNSIPDITNIKFEEDANYHINIGGTETSYIKINESNLDILYLEDGQTWTADCSR